MLPKLTPDLLLSDAGLGFVLCYFPKAFKPRALPGHEVEDLGNLIKIYADWQSRLIPYYSFEQFVRKVEKVGASNRVRGNFKVLHFLEMFENLMRLNDNEKALISTLMWVCWCERNNVREGRKGRDPDELAWVIKHQADAFCNLNKREKMEVNLLVPKWKPPDQEYIKINIDGSYIEEGGFGGWGAVMRDHAGDVQVCAAGHLNYLQNSLHAEVSAAGRALQIASEKGMGRVLLETDATMLKDALAHGGQDKSSLRLLIEGIKLFIRLNFIDVQVVYCSRTCNSVAHALAAKGTLMSGEPELVTDSMLPCVSGLVASDLLRTLV